LLSRFFAAGARGAWYFAPLFALYYRMVLPSPLAAEQRRRIVAHGRERASAMSQAWSSFGTHEADIRDTAASLQVPVWIAWARIEQPDAFAAGFEKFVPDLGPGPKRAALGR
jgi:hypothetical protein